MKRKIGLVIAHHNTNYGALLQGYATQQVLESMGFETEIVDYRSFRFRRGIKFDFGLIPYVWSLFQASRKRNSVKPNLDEMHQNNKQERIKRWHEFESTMLHNIKCYHGYPSLRKRATELDAILIGSDQLWLPGVCFGSYLSLRFAEGTRRISYATSLGVSEYPQYSYHSARTMFDSIDYLSVREEQGKKIIQTISPNLPVEVVCDPTYLLSKQEWEERIAIQKMSNEPYILCYFLGNSATQLRMAKEYSHKQGMKLYSILSDESVVDGDTTIPDKVITGASVEEFVNFIRGAKHVITDSFHGLAFSVINEKQFSIFYRKRADVKVHRNSRIDNILEMWQLKHRLIKPDAVSISPECDIDYGKVTSLIVAKRAESMDFLKKALLF